MSYGVLPTGFSRKPLNQILAEQEALLITELGPGVIQTPQSPLGQISGLFASLTATLWEIAEDVYQSRDPDQTEGVNLDLIGRLRLLSRAGGETDADFRAAITNQGQARIDVQDISRAVFGLDGVTYAQVFLNDTTEVDSNRLPPGAMAVAVIGGDDAEVAAQMRRYVVPGISTYGNLYVSSVEDGFCRTMNILRPIPVPVTLTVTVRVSKDLKGCPPPSMTAVRDALLLAFSTTHLMRNGDDITYFRVRSVIESLFPNVEVVGLQGSRPDQGASGESIVPIDFLEIATFDPEDVIVDAM